MKDYSQLELEIENIDTEYKESDQALKPIGSQFMGIMTTLPHHQPPQFSF